VRLVPWLGALARFDVPIADVERLRFLADGAYDLVDELPRGPARAAAWNAYVLQTYADKLLVANRATHRVRSETAAVTETLYRLAAAWVARARLLAAGAADDAAPAPPGPLPHWHTPYRCQEDLAGMRETLEALRIYLAYDLQRFPLDEEELPRLRAALDAVDAKLETAHGLWVPRAPAELRGGIGAALAAGLDGAYELGRELARLT